VKASAQWSVPARGDTAGEGFYTVGLTTWTTMDLDGDRKPDLVNTGMPGVSKVFGGDTTAYWNVDHLGSRRRSPT
jgi:hypothetical protein